MFKFIIVQPDIGYKAFKKVCFLLQYVYRGFLQTRDTPAVKKLLSRNFAGDGRVETGYLVRVPRGSMCPPRTFDLISNFNATVSSNFLPPRSAGEFC